MLSFYKKLNASLEKIKSEASNLEEYLGSKVEMKFEIEISVLIISTVLTFFGLLGEKN
jgi:hypothetical protein